MFASPPGAFLPNGGADHGHKGYCHGVVGGGADRWFERTRSRRSQRGLGLDDVRAIARPGAVRRSGGVRAPDDMTGECVSRGTAASGRGAGSVAGRTRPPPARGTTPGRSQAESRCDVSVGAACTGPGTVVARGPANLVTRLSSNAAAVSGPDRRLNSTTCRRFS